MGNVYRYTHLFIYEFSFFLVFFLLMLMNMQKQNLHINTLNKKLCLVFNLVPGSVFSDELLLRYESFCRYTHFL